MEEQISQLELIFEYYETRPNEEVPHEDVVDWALEEYKQRTGKVFRDPDRSIRKLYELGRLVKIRKGVYKYDPLEIYDRKPEDFTDSQRKEILDRDGHSCAICGLGTKDGVEIQVDHIKPRSKGGKAELSNGQVLCGRHNYIKKTYSQTESGKKYFVNLLQLAEEAGDEPMIEFCRDVLTTYEEHNINGHIQWT